MLVRFYRTPALSDSALRQVTARAQHDISLEILNVSTEWCYYVQFEGTPDQPDLEVLSWLLGDTLSPQNFGQQSFLLEYREVLEVGPRLNFETPWSSAAVSICRACGVEGVVRIERSIRIGIPIELTAEQKGEFLCPLHDRMTEMVYPQPLASFDHGILPGSLYIIPLIEGGKDALRTVNIKLGLGMDEQDIDYCYRLFVQELGRNPTSVELFQLGVANSEHSRHPWFNGRMVIDGVSMSETLMDILKMSWRERSGNTVVAFAGSAIRGYWADVLLPASPGQPSALELQRLLMHSVVSAETHNHPCLWEPYHGAGTGKGGGIRDIQVFGKGARVLVGGAGYCVGNLHIPGYILPWEEDGWGSLPIVVSPLEIFIRASDGASDYANCFGQPVVYGFARTFGCALLDGYRSWFKPVMFTVDVGQTQNLHVKAGSPEKGMTVVQIGGPGYRIGIGGGSASSMVQGQNDPELDFNSVQRGNPEMEQHLERCVRACVSLGDRNPIVKMNDLGAGGLGNGVTELVHPAGARIEVSDIPVGDQTLSVLEIWGNESQERNVVLVRTEEYDVFKGICDREKLPCQEIGWVTGGGWIVLADEKKKLQVLLPLDRILGALPQKTFALERASVKRAPILLPEDLTVRQALERVLRLPAVASKRWLVTKADRSVGGLVAQQQCVGPNHIPISDFAVVADSHFGLTGKALSLGEQPLKGLISSQAMARLAITEAILNMAGARITTIGDVKVLANWMTPAKMPGEGVWLYEAACALREACRELGAEIGGKDSLSMAALALRPDGRTETVKAPGQLVISATAPIEDVTCKVGPDLKHRGHTLVYLPVNPEKWRLGGTALAQVYGQAGDECPDVENLLMVRRIFEVVQEAVAKGWVCAVHDVSDGGLVTTFLEMAFAGNTGLRVSTLGLEIFPVLFSEEPGVVLEVQNLEEANAFFGEREVAISPYIVGVVEESDCIAVIHNGKEVLNERMTTLRTIWEETSTQLDRLQANPETAEEEARANEQLLSLPPYELTFTPVPTPEIFLRRAVKPKIAVVREQGSNGDQEMAAAFYSAGFEPVDVMMSDLHEGRITLNEFHMLALVGGFAYMDVPEAAKGWAATILYSERLREQFDRFYNRSDTLSLGVCNGCQLMALLGWVPWQTVEDSSKVRFLTNRSERFESRFPAVKVMASPAVLLRSMEGSVLGVWSSHKEGRLTLPSDAMLQEILSRGLAPLCYVDEKGEPTARYPFNPNGSPAGIAGLCTSDGRHLAAMVHMERTFQNLHWSWMPEDWRQNLRASPWMRMFQNAYDFCKEA